MEDVMARGGSENENYFSKVYYHTMVVCCFVLLYCQDFAPLYGKAVESLDCRMVQERDIPCTAMKRVSSIDVIDCVYHMHHFFRHSNRFCRKLVW